jgi:hypothetical protein
MEPVVDKQELLKILEENRDKHRSVFEKALEGFKKQTRNELNRALARVGDGNREDVFIHLQAPSDHTSEYDRAIKTVKLHQGDTIQLTEKDVAHYIQDDWGWKRQWLDTSSTYAAAAVQKVYDSE